MRRPLPLLIWIVSANEVTNGEYLGCWNDNPSFEAMDHYAGREFDIPNCISYCSTEGYNYAGISFAFHCFCGDQYAKFGSADESSCDLNCLVGPGVCGGIDKLSVWSVDGSISANRTYEPSVLSTTQPSLSLTLTPTSDATNNIPTSNTIEPSRATIPEPTLSLSSRPTSHSSSEAPLIPSVAPTSYQTTSPTLKPVATTSQTEAAVADEHEYMGCYMDGPYPAMSFSTGYKFGIRHCIAFCSFRNFKYAGLRYFDQCSCGNSYARNGAAPESECSSNCKYGGGKCGGRWRISVWGTRKLPTPQPTPGPTPQPTTPTRVSTFRPGFNIDLELQGVDNDYEFRNALSKWERVIRGDLPDLTGQLPGESACGAWPNYVDDLYICGRYHTIDGPGGILGSAGPRYYRSSGTPITGEMVFDSQDVDQEWLNLLGIILHEMGHVLGIGPLWTVNGLVSSRQVPCPYGIFTKATREYRVLTGCTTSIPVEQSFEAPGSNCGHWSEECFDWELMTPAAGSDLPMSRITIAGLDDLGYQVDYSEADDYDSSNINPKCICNSGLLNDRRKLPSLASNTTRRRLSDEGLETAREYGRRQLSYNRYSQPQSLTTQMPEGVEDLGQEVIYVLYMENNTIHQVMVTVDDIE